MFLLTSLTGTQSDHHRGRAGVTLDNLYHQDHRTIHAYRKSHKKTTDFRLILTAYYLCFRLWVLMSFWVRQIDHIDRQIQTREIQQTQGYTQYVIVKFISLPSRQKLFLRRLALKASGYANMNVNEDFTGKRIHILFKTVFISRKNRNPCTI